LVKPPYLAQITVNWISVSTNRRLPMLRMRTVTYNILHSNEV